MSEEERLDAIESLLPAYALNALDDEDRALVEGALTQQPRYREQLAEYLGIAAQLAGLHAAAAPSAALRERVLGSIPVETAPPANAANPPASTLSRRPRRTWRSVRAWAVAAAVVLALVGFSSTSIALLQQVDDLRQQMDTLAAEAEETELRLLAQQGLVYWVAQPGVTTVAMRGSNPPLATMGTVRQPRGLVMRAPDGESVLVAINLPLLQEYYSYQAWAWDSQGRPYSLGVFEVDDNGYAQILVDYPSHAGNIYVMSVSVEPAGGSVTPSGQTVLLGLPESP